MIHNPQRQPGGLAAAGAVASAGRESGLVYKAVRQSPTCRSVRFVHRGLLRLGVKRFQRVGTNCLTRVTIS